jgi:actin related protein 2/3 complex subunit 1A/1B
MRDLNFITRPPPSVWGEKLPFNTVCGEYSSPSGGWVHSVGFSPSGDVLAFASRSPSHPPCFSFSQSEYVGHDSTINIVYPGGPTIYSIRSNSLPYISLTWAAEDAIVAAGHDCQPVLFSGGPSGWQALGSLDDTTAPKSSVGGRGGVPGSSPVGRLNSAAFNTFRNADSRGLGSSPGGGTQLATDTELFTVHQNTITNVRPYEGAPGGVTRVSTSGVDGKLVIWNVNAVSGLGTKLKALRVG